jgi:hypothetical protein
VDAKAQDINISDSLIANGDKLKVKMGGQGFGKILKMRFGDYAVVSSKAGWVIESTKGNFFNTKTDNKSTEKFSFVFSNKTDSAKVNAAKNVEVQSLHEIELIPHFSWGENKLEKMSTNFTAFITINSDTSNTWALLMNVVVNGSNATENYEAFLTDGSRKIFILPASSNKNGMDKRSQPALGYEFTEKGQSLCAVQYYGGGMFGMNKEIVWLRKELNEKMKLLLAATATAILQIKVATPNGF